MPATIGKCRYEKESRAISLRSRPGAAFDRRRSATRATTSKYSHHSAAATAVAEHRRDHHAGVDAHLGADADRDDRLAQRDEHDQPVALGEVARLRASSPSSR